MHILTRVPHKALQIALAIFATVALSLGVAVAVATAAHAANSNSASTTITNNYDSGGQGNWANDNFTRTLTFTQEDASYCVAAFGSPVPAGEVCDQATIADSGKFTTLLNAFQPNQGFTTQSNKTILNVVSGNFTGSDSWAIETQSTNEPDPTLVTSQLNDNFTHPTSGADSTSQWYLQAFLSAPSAVKQLDWSWVYTTGCNETWTDSSASGAGHNGFDGQSSPTSIDGNITGISNCPPPVTDSITLTNPGNETTVQGNPVFVTLTAISSKGNAISNWSSSGLPLGLSLKDDGNGQATISGTPTAPGVFAVSVTAGDGTVTQTVNFNWTVNVSIVLPPPTSIRGNFVNQFGSGFNAFRQQAYWNSRVASWPATQHDPASSFLQESLGGSNFRLEYAPNGVGTGWCVSNADGVHLVFRICNSNVWQSFHVSGDQVVSNVNQGDVQANGNGAQLTVGSPNRSYHWVNFSSLPA